MKKRKRLKLELEERKKNKKERYTLRWRPMSFTRDTIDGGEFTQKHRNSATY